MTESFLCIEQDDVMLIIGYHALHAAATARLQRIWWYVCIHSKGEYEGTSQM